MVHHAVAYPYSRKLLRLEVLLISRLRVIKNYRTQLGHVFAYGPPQMPRAYKRSIQNGLILPAAAILDELAAAVPVPVADPLLVDVPDEVIPLAVELSPPIPVPVADAVELAGVAPDEPDDALVVSLVQLAVKKT